jgi:hypothetical protein
MERSHLAKHAGGSFTPIWWQIGGNSNPRPSRDTSNVILFDVSSFTKWDHEENIPASNRFIMSAEVFVSYARVNRERVV